MKETLIFISLFFFTFFGCQKTNSTNRIIDRELEKLKTIEDKKAYLEAIFEADQELRRSSEDSEIMLKYGVNSKEHIAFTKRMIAQDSINLIKIEKYLAKYGYPKLKDFGEIATCTPNVVIHHAQSYEARERNFECLYGAYLNGNNGGMAMLLGRMYRMKYRKSFRIDGPFTSEGEINQLISKLGLESRQAKVLQKLKKA